MTTQPDSSLTGYLAKLRAITATWFSQVLFYLVLVVVFFVVDQLVVVDIYRRYFYIPGASLNFLFELGGWVPGLSNAIVLALAVRIRMHIAYLISTVVLNVILAETYFHLSGRDIVYRNDSWGDPGTLMIWQSYWFWGGVIGFAFSIIGSIKGRKQCHTKSK